uniref:Uncharacterized protein n=1 Tax=Lepeophtheirus salmonis TaxID=72036 RepID=A0A0K2U2A3_LEPSM
MGSLVPSIETIQLIIIQMYIIINIAKFIDQL